MTIERRRFLTAGLAALSALPAAAVAGLSPAALARAPGGPALAGGAATLVGAPSLAAAAPAMDLVLLADTPSTPTGLAIAPDGRVFMMMPRFTGAEAFTLCEIAADGSATPYPDAAANRPDPERPQDTLFFVTNGVFDEAGGLWVLDAGLSSNSGPPVAGAPKLVRFDLARDVVDRVVPLEAGVEPTSSLNDLRVDTKGGRARAFVTDQGQDGEGAVLAVDLATGRVVRRLAGHASTASQKGVLKLVESRPLAIDRGNGTRQPVSGGANGIALSPDGARLYYAPLMGRRLYAVSTDDLLDKDASDAMVAGGVEDLGEKGLTGGLGCDAEDRVYLTLQEHNAIGRRHPSGTIEIVGADPALVWADTIVIAPDGWLYVNGAQVNRRPEYNGGEDRQAPPYAILRVQVGAGPA